jgi:hypothetical protein
MKLIDTIKNYAIGVVSSLSAGGITWLCTKSIVISLISALVILIVTFFIVIKIFYNKLTSYENELTLAKDKLAIFETDEDDKSCNRLNCRLRKIIPYIENNMKNTDFTVIVPIYEMKIDEVDVNTVIDVEARLKREIIIKLNKRGMKYKGLKKGERADSSLNEIYIGSPIANNKTALQMTDLKNFEYRIPANNAANCTNYTKCTVVPKVVKVNGLRLNFEEFDEELEVIQKIPNKPDKNLTGMAVNYKYCVADKDESFTIRGKSTVTVFGQGNISGDYTIIKEVDEDKKIIRIGDNQTVTVKCTTKQEWSFTIEGRAPFICDENKDYAVIVKQKKDYKYIHMLFGTRVKATKLAVEYLLKYHDKLPSEGEYFRLIHIGYTKVNDKVSANFIRDDKNNIKFTDCTSDFFNQ